MVGGGSQKKTINWSALTLGFNVLVVVLGALMAYSYINGGVSARLDALEHKTTENAGRITALERR